MPQRRQPGQTHTGPTHDRRIKCGKSLHGTHELRRELHEVGLSEHITGDSQCPMLTLIHRCTVLRSSVFHGAKHSQKQWPTTRPWKQWGGPRPSPLTEGPCHPRSPPCVAVGSARRARPACPTTICRWSPSGAPGPVAWQRHWRYDHWLLLTPPGQHNVLQEVALVRNPPLNAFFQR